MKEWICRELSTSTGNSENGVLMMETELIRCKDCKHHYESKCECWEYISTDDDYFCKDGERKEE